MTGPPSNLGEGAQS